MFAIVLLAENLTKATLTGALNPSSGCPIGAWCDCWIALGRAIRMTHWDRPQANIRGNPSQKAYGRAKYRHSRSSKDALPSTERSSTPPLPQKCSLRETVSER